MPNGGSDCCGTCWFNNKNEGAYGYHGAQKDGIVHCAIRDIDVLDPFYTYCANHPHHTHEKIDLPLGPVYICDGYPFSRKIWLNPPDTEQIRLKLIEVLNSFTNKIEQKYPSATDIEQEVINQLTVLKERRAIPGLLNVIHMDIEEYRFWNRESLELKLIKNKAITVGLAIEALLKISGEEYLSEVEKFINKGQDKLGDTYDMRDDNFAVIRYHLVRGLKYVNNDRAIELLKIAKSDLHDEVSAFADEILEGKIKPEEVLFSKGQHFYGKKDYEHALKYYAAAVKLNPDYFDALLELGNTYNDIGDSENSIKHYTMALNVEPDNYYALYNRGRTYMDAGKYAEAIQDLEKTLGLVPDDDTVIGIINEAKKKIGGE